MTIWTYVIVTDDGGAPNFEQPATTLAICKPKIRKAAQIGDLVLAFNGVRVWSSGERKRFHPDSLRWAGVVSESMPLGEFWGDVRFQGKKPGASKVYADNIYRPVSGGLTQVEGGPHGKGDEQRDIGGKNALVFQKSWYFGAAAPILPTEFGLRMGMDARQGHRRRTASQGRITGLVEWLDKSTILFGATPAHRVVAVDGECGPCSPKRRHQYNANPHC